MDEQFAKQEIEVKKKEILEAKKTEVLGFFTNLKFYQKVVFMTFLVLLVCVVLLFLTALLGVLAPFLTVGFICKTVFDYLIDYKEYNTKLKANKTYCEYLLKRKLCYKKKI